VRPEVIVILSPVFETVTFYPNLVDGKPIAGCAVIAVNVHLAELPKLAALRGVHFLRKEYCGPIHVPLEFREWSVSCRGTVDQ